MASFPTTIIKTKTGETDLSEFLVQLNFNNGIIKTEEGHPLDLNQIKLKTNDGETVVWNRPLTITIDPSFNGAEIEAEIYKDGIRIHEGRVKIGRVPYVISAKYGSKIEVFAFTTSPNTALYPGGNSWNNDGGLNGWDIVDENMTQLKFTKTYSSPEEAKEKIITPALLTRASNEEKAQAGDSNRYFVQGNFQTTDWNHGIVAKGIRCIQRYAGFIWYQFYGSHFLGVVFHGKMQPLSLYQSGRYSRYGTYGFQCDDSPAGQPGMNDLKVDYKDMKGKNGESPVTGNIMYTIFYDGSTVKYRPMRLNGNNWDLF